VIAVTVKISSILVYFSYSLLSLIVCPWGQGPKLFSEKFLKITIWCFLPNTGDIYTYFELAIVGLPESSKWLLFLTS